MAFITACWSLNGMLALMILFVAAYLYMTRKFNYWKNRGVLEMSPTPFLGNFMDCIILKKSPGQLLKDIYDQGKRLPYVGFYVLDKPFLLVRDHELLKNILIKDFNYFANRYATPDTKDRLGYANLFYLQNPAWKFLRTKLSPFFTSGKLKKMFELMLECSNNLNAHLESLRLEEMEIEIKDIIAKFSTDIIGITAFGINVNSLSNPDNEFRKYGKMIFDHNIIRSFEWLAVFFFPNIVRLANTKLYSKDASNFLRKTLGQKIAERIKSGEKRNDLIDILIELKQIYGDQDFGGFKFDGDDLIAQTAIFFTAGYETSSTTISFTLYELATHQEVQNRLRKEIRDALDETDGKITYDMVSSLSYLDMVVSETLRMYPSLPFLDRVTVEAYKVPNSDLVLEKGTPIFIPLLGLHYDPEYFPDPYEYDPERFTEENKRNRPSCVYLPFGDGPRSCIGTRMGLLQVKLGLITILSKYELTPCEKTPIPMIIGHRGVLLSSLDGNLYLNIRRI